MHGLTAGIQNLRSTSPHGHYKVDGGRGQGRYHSTGQESDRGLGNSSRKVGYELTGYWGKVHGLRDARSKVRSRDAIDSSLRGCARFYDSQGQQRQQNPDLLETRVLQWMENVPSEGPNGARDIDAISDVPVASPQKQRGGTQTMTFSRDMRIEMLRFGRIRWQHPSTCE